MDSFMSSSSFRSTIKYNVMGESDHHTLQAYPSVLPVFLIQAISSEASPHRTISVNLSPNGWAWLVYGRRLFVWEYIQTSKSKIKSYELQLPGSDLLHKADLIRLVSEHTSSATHTPGIIAVSPEGIIRYWANVAHPANYTETSVNDLQGQEFFLLVDIAPLRYILGTTTSSLSHICITNNSIACHTLRVPQGVLAGFGRKVSSMLGFAAISHSSENRSLVKIIKSSEPRDIELYVLAGSFLQLWTIVDMYTERLFAEHDLTRTVSDAYLSNVWNRNSHPSQVKLWFIDMIEQHENLLLLVAALNQEASGHISYAVIILDRKSLINSATQLKSFTALKNYTPTYSVDQEANLLSLKMIPNPSFENLIYIHDKIKLLCVDSRNDVIDTIALKNDESFILGAGLLDDGPLLFTSKDNLIRVIPKESISALMESEQKSLVESEIPLEVDASVDTLKNAFRLFRRNEKRECLALVSSFLASLDSSSSDFSLDEMVVAISNELCDESPSADPRWAESVGSSSNRDIILALLADQLQEKLKIHLLFVEFLRSTRIWQQLALITYNGQTCYTRYILCQHMEKIVLTISLKKLQNDYPDILEPAIKYVADHRAKHVGPHTTELDIFYQKVTAIHEMFPVLVQYEQQELSRLDSSKDCLRLVISVSLILVTSLQEVRRFRQAQSTLYESSPAQNCEKIPLTATIGPTGIRPVLLQQLGVLVQNAARSDVTASYQEEEEQLKGTVYQKIVEISDLIFEGYQIHLKSIDPSSERYQSLLKSYEKDRSNCMRPLFIAKQYERLTALAEKYEDFDTLIRICEILENRAKLNRYIEEYRSKGFSEFLFNWYMKEGKQGKMLDTKLQDLGEFLRNREDINWLHYIGMGQLGNAALSLKCVAEKETADTDKKLLALSLSKLCFLAHGDGEAELEQVNSELKRIESIECASQE